MVVLCIYAVWWTNWKSWNRVCETIAKTLVWRTFKLLGSCKASLKQVNLGPAEIIRHVIVPNKRQAHRRISKCNTSTVLANPKVRLTNLPWQYGRCIGHHIGIRAYTFRKVVLAASICTKGGKGTQWLVVILKFWSQLFYSRYFTAISRHDTDENRVSTRLIPETYSHQ
jgi:hypothetical protein